MKSMRILSISLLSMSPIVSWASTMTSFVHPPLHPSSSNVPASQGAQLLNRDFKHSDMRSLVFAKFLWWGGQDDEKGQLPDSDDAKKQQQPGMGGVASVMDSMESFKKAQEVGKRTASVLQELSSMTVEGTAGGGSVRVFVDGKQRPMGVEIDEKYLSDVKSEDLNAAITSAMQEAHKKSSNKMEEKMQALYSELGLVQNTNDKKA
jgi:DNA-binding YbaB/EbfC family protein